MLLVAVEFNTVVCDEVEVIRVVGMLETTTLEEVLDTVREEVAWLLEDIAIVTTKK